MFVCDSWDVARPTVLSVCLKLCTGRLVSKVPCHLNNQPNIMHLVHCSLSQVACTRLVLLDFQMTIYYIEAHGRHLGCQGESLNSQSHSPRAAIQQGLVLGCCSLNVIADYFALRRATLYAAVLS